MVRQLDREMMELAISKARESASMGEVPVGAVLVDPKGHILAAAGNRVIISADPVGHAEILVLRQAAAVKNNFRLPHTTLYVTLEPCPMCASALVHARVERVVFGAEDPKSGAIVSRYAIGTDNLLNHTFSFTAGVMAEECGKILREFFQNRR
jgi:tRNA(adenine34) deaminase